MIGTEIINNQEQLFILDISGKSVGVLKCLIFYNAIKMIKRDICSFFINNIHNSQLFKYTRHQSHALDKNILYYLIKDSKYFTDQSRSHSVQFRIGCCKTGCTPQAISSHSCRGERPCVLGQPQESGRQSAGHTIHTSKHHLIYKPCKYTPKGPSGRQRFS